MSAYILVSFSLMVFGFVMDAIICALGKFPVKAERGAAHYLANMVFRVPFLIWAAYLLWGGA